MTAMRLVSVERSPTAAKEWQATFSHPQAKGKPITQKIRFGLRTDGRRVTYVEHSDEKKRAAWRARHAHEDRTNPFSAASLSWHILWGDSTSIARNIAAYRKLYRLG